MGLYRYKGRLLTSSEAGENMLGETDMVSVAGSEFFCAVDNIKDDEHNLNEVGGTRHMVKRIHMIDIDTNVDTSFKMQFLKLDSNDVYDWDSATVWDVSSVLEGDGLSRINEMLISIPENS